MSGCRLSVAALLAAVTLLTAPGLAWPCVRAPGWPHQVQVDAEAAAAQMAREASSIEVAVAHRMTPDFDFMSRTRDQFLSYPRTADERKVAEEELKFQRQLVADMGAARIHFVVERRLKGGGDSEFSVNGSDEFMLGGAPPRAAKPVRLNRLKYFLDPLDFADWPSPGACAAPIHVRQGQRYLIFRDGRGQILRSDISVRLRGDTYVTGGPAIVPVVSDSDPWLKLVQSKLTDR